MFIAPRPVKLLRRRSAEAAPGLPGLSIGIPLVDDGYPMLSPRYYNHYNPQSSTRFGYMGGSKVTGVPPKWIVFLRENPSINDLGAPLFQETKPSYVTMVTVSIGLNTPNPSVRCCHVVVCKLQHDNAQCSMHLDHLVMLAIGFMNHRVSSRIVLPQKMTSLPLGKNWTDLQFFLRATRCTADTATHDFST